MAYQSLYRKYRPQTFADVVGQQHVTRTLQNALSSGRVAHGYLFTGTRGTAKTTVARLLAKALNCESGEGPVTEPCNACGACRAITAGSSIDVIEMDAASHRGVADIEEVRRSVGYGPMELRYKVFIIDEAHQLSSDAKDAFLKTLEEPPANVVFILATTEPQAIPITIRSRCQQFDFKRGSLTEISARLKYVLDCEGVTYTSDAINLVARGADGSYRDSLSLLEQVLAFAPTRITAAEVNAVLGTLDAEALGQVVQAVVTRDAPTAFALAGQMLDSGKEARTLLKTLSAHFRDLLLVQVGGPAVAAELTPDEVVHLQVQARHFTPEQILKAIDLLNAAQSETRWNNQHRLLVEMTFLKLMNLGDGPPAPMKTAEIVFAPVTEVVQPQRPAPTPVAPPPVAVPTTSVTAKAVLSPKAPPPTAPVDNVDSVDSVDNLEGAQPPSTRPSVVIPPVVVGAAALAAAVGEAEPLFTEPGYEDVSEVEGRLTGGAEATDEQEDESVPAGFFADSAPDAEDEYEPGDPPPVGDSPDMLGGPEEEGDGGFGGGPEEKVPTPDLPVGGGNAAPIPAETGGVATLTKPAPVTSVITPPTEVPEPESSEQHSGQLDLFNIDDVFRAWAHFLGGMQKVSKATQVVMGRAQPMHVDHGVIEIVLPSRFHYEQMNDPKKQEIVRKLLARVLNVDRVQVRFVLSAEAAVPPPPRVEKKKEIRDPLAALEELDREIEAIAPAPRDSRPLPPPQQPRVATSPPVFATSTRPTGPPAAPVPRETVPSYSGPAPWDEGIPEEEQINKPLSERARIAMEHPLVQEVLSVFGGEIVEG